MSEDPRHIGASLDGVVGRIGRGRSGSPSSAVLSAIFARWSEIAGDAVAAHARPSTLREGVLTVDVDHPAWATQLKFLTPAILTSLDSIVGEGAVESIRLRVRRC